MLPANPASAEPYTKAAMRYFAGSRPIEVAPLSLSRTAFQARPSGEANTRCVRINAAAAHASAKR